MSRKSGRPEFGWRGSAPKRGAVIGSQPCRVSELYSGQSASGSALERLVRLPGGDLDRWGAAGTRARGLSPDVYSGARRDPRIRVPQRVVRLARGREPEAHWMLK